MFTRGDLSVQLETYPTEISALAEAITNLSKVVSPENSFDSCSSKLVPALDKVHSVLGLKYQAFQPYDKASYFLIFDNWRGLMDKAFPNSELDFRDWYAHTFWSMSLVTASTGSLIRGTHLYSSQVQTYLNIDVGETPSNLEKELLDKLLKGSSNLTPFYFKPEREHPQVCFFAPKVARLMSLSSEVTRELGLIKLDKATSNQRIQNYLPKIATINGKSAILSENDLGPGIPFFGGATRYQSLYDWILGGTLTASSIEISDEEKKPNAFDIEIE